MRETRNKTLVLRDEGARHPFRLSLPRDILRIAEEEVAGELTAPPVPIWRNEDVHLFLFSFLAFFTAFYIFIF